MKDYLPITTTAQDYPERDGKWHRSEEGVTYRWQGERLVTLHKDHYNLWFAEASGPGPEPSGDLWSTRPGEGLRLKSDAIREANRWLNG